jgi:two-component system, NtrC family, response regulator AtoC
LNNTLYKLYIVSKLNVYAQGVETLRPTTRMLAAAPVAQPLHLLVLAAAGSKSYVLPSSGEVRIGRAPDCNVVLDDETLSRHHAALTIGQDGVALADLGSANGTFVDGRRLALGEMTPIAPGTVIQLASVTVVLRRGPATSKVRVLRSHEYFVARVEEECVRAAANGTSFGILSVRSEPSAIALTEVLSRTFRPCDVIATYARGEYEVLVDQADASAVNALSAALVAELASAEIVATVGVAVFPDHARTAPALIDISRNGSPPPLASRPRLARIGALERLRPLTERVARSELNVLVLGETGVGKELLATMVHDLSPRRSKPIVAVNCAAVGDSLFESELFGYERGAFTGAVQAKPGLLESADGGSIFLDEVGELTLAAQAKLLRVIERRETQRIGALRPKSIDVRFIAATNRILEAEVESGTFRRDLYFRLNGMTLVLPPLRERVDEIEQLARAFIEQVCRSSRRSVHPRISHEAMMVLRRHDWPGNVRELKNVIERAVVLCTDDEIRVQHLPTDLFGRPNAVDPGMKSDTRIATERRLTSPPRMLAQTPQDGVSALAPLSRGFDGSDTERQKIEAALVQCGGNQAQAARLLGVSRGTLVSRIELYGLPRPRKQVGGASSSAAAPAKRSS